MEIDKSAISVASTVTSWNRKDRLPAGHRLYTSPPTLKKAPWKADNDDVKISKLTRSEFLERMSDKASEDCAVAEGKPIPNPVARPPTKRVVPVEPQADWEVWIGARFSADNDNKSRKPVTRPNDGPTADVQPPPGQLRSYEGDVLSRLTSTGDHKSALILRAIGTLLSDSTLTAANDNFAVDADNEIEAGFGLDYHMEQEKTEDVIVAYEETGRLPSGRFKFRQRSGNPGGRLTALHRKQESMGLHFDRYLALKSLAPLPPQEYPSTGERSWWRSHDRKSSQAAAELADACDRTDWKKVTWTRFAPMGARVYGSLSIHSEMEGVGAGKTSAPQPCEVHGIYRRQSET